jgi:hypothetical protein
MTGRDDIGRDDIGQLGKPDYGKAYDFSVVLEGGLEFTSGSEHILADC